MSSPRERLQAILNAISPSEVRFKAAKTYGSYSNDQTVYFLPVKTKELTYIELEDSKLQAVMMKNMIQEHWNPTEAKYKITVTADELFYGIMSRVQSEYDSVSERCAATKRKTSIFLGGIKLDDKHLPNYLIQMYITIVDPAFDNKLISERRAFFEPLEALRRTYGKR